MDQNVNRKIRKYTKLQLLRYPMVFGSILASFSIMFYYRRTYFAADIKRVQERNFEERKRTAGLLTQFSAANQELIERHKMKKEG